MPKATSASFPFPAIHGPGLLPYGEPRTILRLMFHLPTLWRLRPMAFFRPVKSPAGRRVLRQRGSAITEFAIVAPCLVLTLFGTVGLGTMLGRYIQATTVCRDLAHMYVDGVDFTQT